MAQEQLYKCGRLKMESMRNMRGFTLIELLVVVAIIGILAAIAIPQFALYRQRGYDARAQADLRNAATAEEAYFVDNNDYVTCGDCTAVQSNLGFTCSKGVVMSLTKGTGSFTGTAYHLSGTLTFTYDSTAGGLTNGS
jgi:type IV pilus assembly protein PilA